MNNSQQLKTTFDMSWRIAELEADNQRLREALDQYDFNISADHEEPVYQCGLCGAESYARPVVKHNSGCLRSREAKP